MEWLCVSEPNLYYWPALYMTPSTSESVAWSILAYGVFASE